MDLAGCGLEYFNIFNSDAYDLSFEADEKGNIRIKAETYNEPATTHYFDISIVNGNIALSEGRGDALAYWGEQGVNSSYTGG